LQFLWETNNKTGRYYYWHSNSDGQADRGRSGQQLDRCSLPQVLQLWPATLVLAWGILQEFIMFTRLKLTLAFI